MIAGQFSLPLHSHARRERDNGGLGRRPGKLLHRCVPLKSRRLLIMIVSTLSAISARAQPDPQSRDVYDNGGIR